MTDQNSPSQSSSGPGLVAVCSFPALLSTVFVVLRIWARRLLRQRPALDDYLCLAALICQHGLYAVAVFIIAKGDLGKPTTDYEHIVIMFKAIFAGEILFTFSSTLVKLSVLALYWRLFPTYHVRLGCKIISALNVAWCIAMTIVNFAHCRPLRAFWLLKLQQSEGVRCYDSAVNFTSNAIANCVIDFLTITLPVYEVSKLRISTRRKITIGCIFLLGGIAFAASVVRSVFTGSLLGWEGSALTGQSEVLVAPIITTVIEVYFAIIGACMPTLVPVYRQLRHGSPFTSHCHHVSPQLPQDDQEKLRSRGSRGRLLSVWRSLMHHDRPGTAKYGQESRSNVSSNVEEQPAARHVVEQYQTDRVAVLQSAV